MVGFGEHDSRMGCEFAASAGGGRCVRCMVRYGQTAIADRMKAGLVLITGVRRYISDTCVLCRCQAGSAS